MDGLVGADELCGPREGALCEGTLRWVEFVEGVIAPNHVGIHTWRCVCGEAGAARELLPDLHQLQGQIDVLARGG